MDNLVSVIIPCYNAENFIDNSIRSVWEQNYQGIELIVVDDGSTDRSRDRIKAWEQRFAEKGYILKYIHQDNQGPGSATNTGLKHVTGAYLTLLDADDVYLPGAIGKKAQFLDTYPDYAGVRNNGWRVSGADRRLFITDEREKQITDLFTALSFGKTNNWAGTYMVRTSILFEAYPDRNIDPSRLGQNFQILLPVAYGRKFGYIDEPLMEYRIQPESHSQAADANVQYKKERSNSIGWRDIYMHILDWLVADPKEHQYYRSAYDSVFHRASMIRAIIHKKAADAKEEYLLLKQTGYLTMEDRIQYAAAFYPLRSYLLRAVYKVSRILCGRR